MRRGYVAPIVISLFIFSFAYSVVLITVYDTDDSDAPSEYGREIVEVNDEYITFRIGDMMFREYSDGKIRYVATATMYLDIHVCTDGNAELSEGSEGSI